MRAQMTACALAVMRRAEVSSPTPGGADRVQAGAGASPVHPPSLSKAGVEPARPKAPRFERGVSTVPATWTSQCPGRESNSHARLERRLLRPVCLPVVPPPGRDCGSRIRTDGLRGMSPAICHLIYPAINLNKDNTVLPEGIEPPTSWTATRRSQSN